MNKLAKKIMGRRSPVISKRSEPDPGPIVQESSTVSGLRQTIYERFAARGLVPVSRNGKLAGVIISVGDIDAKQANRIEKRLAFNQRQAIDELLSIALEEK